MSFDDPSKPNQFGSCDKMPTVLKWHAFRVVIYPNDHRPAHVHVQSAGNEAVFDLRCPNGPPSMRENFGFSNQAAKQIAGVLNAQLAKLCGAWKEIHGDYG